MIDRTAVNRALAKAIAFKQCGKDDEANDWARQLVEMLGCAGILAAPSLSGLVKQAKQAANRANTHRAVRHDS